MLYFKEEPILGYCVDSGFREDVFEFFFQASTVIVDARDNGTKEHASVGTLFSGIKNKVIILSIEIKKRQKFSYIYTGLFLTENSPPEKHGSCTVKLENLNTKPYNRCKPNL